jgi:hypothetical protein
MEQAVIEVAKSEPVSADTPRYGEWFFRACELQRLLDQEVRTTERKYGRGRRRLLLDRASLRARQLCAALAPLADIPDL